ncbi:MAG TPA: PKD domain-containing protein [Candidatus Hydrogenedentes bacterium]|nr:PKD domain-containing protein [Candidatus Hydrogenedentota bacterium]
MKKMFRWAFAIGVGFTLCMIAPSAPVVLAQRANGSGGVVHGAAIEYWGATRAGNANGSMAVLAGAGEAGNVEFNGENAALIMNPLHLGAGKEELTVDFSAVPTTGVPPLTVQFTDLSGGGIYPIIDWEWDFGDGQNSFEQHPEHVFEQPGAYTVTLTVSTAGDSRTVSKENYIVVESALPVSFAWLLLPILLLLFLVYGRKREGILCA